MATSNTGTLLPGLRGDNPLGFFAALGLQTLSPEPAYIKWSEDTIIPTAAIDSACSLKQLASKAAKQMKNIATSSSLSPKPINRNAKFLVDNGELRKYLQDASQGCFPSFAFSLCAEGSSYLKNGNLVGKPSDFYFAAARQQFLSMATDILNNVTCHDIFQDISQPWIYAKRGKSMGWDGQDERTHALSAEKPAPENKFVNPGAEALAVVGFARFPVFPGKMQGKDRTLTTGCSGTWNNGIFAWPLWGKFAGIGAVDSMLQIDLRTGKADVYKHSTSVFRVYQCQIKRTAEGGLGSFEASTIAWAK